MYCDTMDLVGKVRGERLGRDHGLVPDHGLVHEISGFLFKSVIVHKSNYRSLKPYSAVRWGIYGRIN